MRRLAAPLFILFLTALAFAQVDHQAPETETPPPVERAQPSAPSAITTPETPKEAAPSSETSPAPPEAAKTMTPPPVKQAEPATTAAEEAAAAATPPEAANDALEIIVIASNSLNEQWGDQSKVAAIKDAMRKSIRYVPKNMDVGLRVSGHRVPASEADRSCQDSELMIAPKAQGQSILLAELGGIQAEGVHSILQTLSRSLADLNDYSGKKNIILITDGEEACVEQDPTAYLAAESLGRRGYRIYIQGIGLSQDQSQGLMPLAKLTGGNFSSATEPLALQRDLVSTLRQVSGEAPEGAAEASPSTPQAAPKPMAQQKEEGAAPPIPASPPPRGVQPEPKEPPIVGPAPLPFNPTEFMKTMVGEIKKILPKPPKPAPPPPPPPTPTFSATSLTIIIVEGILLALALVGIVLLALKQYRQ